MKEDGKRSDVGQFFDISSGFDSALIKFLKQILFGIR